MKKERLNPKALTERDCDDWFNILKGKKITDTHPEIEHDANILRDFFAEYREEKKQQRKEKRQQWLAAYLKPQPVFATLFLAATSLVIFTMLPNNEEQDSEVPEAFIPTRNAGQSGLIRASNSPKTIKHVEKHVAQLSQIFADLNFEKIRHKEGVMVRIIIKGKPDAELLKKLHHYGFGTGLGKQYLYFKEK